MTAEQAKETAIEARIAQIQSVIHDAAKEGLFEARTEKLTAEQKHFLNENGYKVREIEQKGGSTYSINWD